MNQNLTTLSKFKSWYNIPPTNTTDDDLLNDLIASASFDILAYLERKSLFRNTYPDYYDGTGGMKLMLREWPVIAVSSLTINGIAQVAAVPPATGYFLDPYDGWPPGRPQFLNMVGWGCGYGMFTRGIKNVYVNYTAGYCVQGEAATIAGSPYQITVQQSLGPWAQDDGVTDATTGAAFSRVDSSPATGEYSVDQGVYSFAAADDGTDVLISYSFVPTPIQQACYKIVGEQYAYRQRIGQKMHTLSGNTTVSFDNSILTDSIIKKLQPYKRMVPF